MQGVTFVFGKCKLRCICMFVCFIPSLSLKMGLTYGGMNGTEKQLHPDIKYIKQCLSAAKSLRSCPTLCDAIDGQPTRLPRPWDSPGKNTGVGCHFLLQCMKVKSESEVAQSCLTLSDPMDHSLPGSSVHGIF